MTMTIHSIPFHILFGCELLLCEIWWHMTIIHHQIQILFKLPLLLVNKHRKSPIFMWKTGRVGRICGKSHWASSLALDARQPSTAQRNAQRATRGRHGVRAVVAGAATAALGVATMLGDDVLPRGSLGQSPGVTTFPGRSLGVGKCWQFVIGITGSDGGFWVILGVGFI